jgi:hypothetical protein
MGIEGDMDDRLYGSETTRAWGQNSKNLYTSSL